MCMADLLKQQQEAKRVEPRHICIYGAPKSGKTELVGALAKEFKLHWFSLDGGHKTLLKPSSAAYQYLQNIDLYYLRDSQTYPIGVETMLKVVKSTPVDRRICNKHGKVDCPICKLPEENQVLKLSQFTDKDILVIDNYNQLMNSVLNNMFKDELAKDNFDFKADWDDWRKQGSISDRFGSTIQVAPYHVIVLTHEILAEQEDGAKKLSPIGGTRNKSSDFGGWFDDVVYCEIVNGEYKAYSSADKKTRIVVGSRTGKKLQDSAGKQLGLVELFK